MAAHALTLILIFFAIISYYAQNNAVTISILILILMRITPLSSLFPYIEKKGIQVGIIVLTVSAMAPLVSGSLPESSLIKSFSSIQSIIAILVGVFVAWLGGRGVGLMSDQPSVIGSLFVGTIIGVAFFGGVPVGPLIAAGIVSFFSTYK
jgi:uncharacterized membrane protein (DUF441 family)